MQFIAMLAMDQLTEEDVMFMLQLTLIQDIHIH